MLSTRLPSDFPEFISKYYTLVDNLRETYQKDIRILHQRIDQLEKENDQLRNQDSHAVFNIDYTPTESTIVEQLRTELQRTRVQVDLLQQSLNEQFLAYEDMKTKYNLQKMMNDNDSSDNPTKSKELEGQLQRIKDQIHLFDQCHYESEEQLRLLKDILNPNDLPSINQSVTVKQTDLNQQMDIIENLLNKQEEKLLEKFVEFFDTSSTTTKKKTKRKRV